MLPGNTPPADGVLVSFAVNGSRSSDAIGSMQLSGYENYFIGNDARRHAGNCSRFARVASTLDNGVRLVYYEKGGSLEYDIELQSMASVDALEMTCEGADTLRVNTEGNLVAETSLGTIVQSKPVAFVINSAGKRTREFPMEFELRGKFAFGFRGPNAQLDSGERLVIDPGVVLYGKYLGGSGLDQGNGIGVDQNGVAYVAGETASINFPTTTGAFDITKNGGSDIFVTAINPLGTRLVYSTFIGGSNNDRALGLTTSPTGVAYITGDTTSTDFYNGGSSPWQLNTFISGIGASDAILARVGITGYPTGVIPPSPTPPGVNPNDYQGWCTVFGGGGLDSGRGVGLEKNPTGGDFRVFITGTTSSTYASIISNFAVPFPPSFVLAQPAQILRGPSDAFILRVTQAPIGFGVDFDYCLFVGGDGDEVGLGITSLSLDTVAIVGKKTTSTTSTFSPAITPNATQPSYGGGASDGFVVVADVKFVGPYQQYSIPVGPQPGTISYPFVTYCGGSDADSLTGVVAVDAATTPNVAFVLACGSTWSSDFPVTTGAYQTVLNQLGGVGSDAVIMKYSGVPKQLTGPIPPFPAIQIAYSTYLGAYGNDEALGISAEGDQATIVGIARHNNNFFPPTYSFPTTVPPSANLGGLSDAFIAQFNSNGTALNYCFRTGGSLEDYGVAICLDANNDPYITGSTVSTNIPITGGTFGQLNSGAVDAFVLKFR